MHIKITNISVIDTRRLTCTYQNHCASLFRFMSKFCKTLLIKWCWFWISPKLLSGDIYILSISDISSCCGSTKQNSFIQVFFVNVNSLLKLGKVAFWGHIQKLINESVNFFTVYLSHKYWMLIVNLEKSQAAVGGYRYCDFWRKINLSLLICSLWFQRQLQDSYRSFYL